MKHPSSMQIWYIMHITFQHIKPTTFQTKITRSVGLLLVYGFAVLHGGADLPFKDKAG